MKDDLISRQAAIDALEREKTYSTAYKDGYTQTDYFKQYNMGLTDGIKALNKLPSAQPQSTMGQVNDTAQSTNDYIRKQAAIEVADAVWTVTGDKNVAKVWDQLKDLPSADVVEVVRCRDCKFNPNDTWFDCPMVQLPYKEDRWCWKGERKDG